MLISWYKTEWIWCLTLSKTLKPLKSSKSFQDILSNHCGFLKMKTIKYFLAPKEKNLHVQKQWPLIKMKFQQQRSQSCRSTSDIWGSLMIFWPPKPRYLQVSSSAILNAHSLSHVWCLRPAPLHSCCRVRSPMAGISTILLSPYQLRLHLHLWSLLVSPSGQPQLLSMTSSIPQLSCHQYYSHRRNSQTLPSSSVNLRCRVGPCAPWIASVCSTWGNTPQILSPWCWSLMDNSRFFSPRWPASIVTIKQNFHFLLFMIKMSDIQPDVGISPLRTSQTWPSTICIVYHILFFLIFKFIPL